MREGEHRSIGEVLNLLKPEFDDVTISKIRFLESQGLVEPIRTPSGYRMFCDADIERLRFILRTQREKFLPLKVIKQRLDEGGVGRPVDDAGDSDHDGPLFDVGTTGESMSFDELASTVGVSKTQLTKLQDAGVITGARTRSGVVYDDDAVSVARAAARLLDAGLEVRHLRSYKVAAEREAGILEQLLAPVAHTRGHGSRDTTLRSLESVVGSGEELRRSMLRRALRDTLLH